MGVTPDTHPVVRGVHALAGTVLGIVIAVASVWSLVRRSPRMARASAHRDRERLARWFGADAVRDLPDRDAVGYLMGRVAYGPVIGAVILIAAGASLAYTMWTIVLFVGQQIPTVTALVSVTVGVIGAYVAVQAACALGRFDVRFALRRLGQDQAGIRIRALERTRADVIRSVDDERRRIERAIHDGVQQRAVVLMLEVGNLRRGMESGSRDLVSQLDMVHTQAQSLLQELRAVAWQVYPAVLDDQGLHAALRGLSSHSHLPVRLQFSVAAEPPREVSAAVYYVAAEAVTNAAKHSGAERVDLVVSGSADVVTLIATDDGAGGADPEGGGLVGLARRVAALDGTLGIDSPLGGGTTLEVQIPWTS